MNKPLTVTHNGRTFTVGDTVLHSHQDDRLFSITGIERYVSSADGYMIAITSVNEPHQIIRSFSRRLTIVHTPESETTMPIANHIDRLQSTISLLEKDIERAQSQIAAVRKELKDAKRKCPTAGSYRFTIIYAGTQKEYIHLMQVVDASKIYVTGFEGARSWSEFLEWIDHQRERNAEVRPLSHLIWDRTNQAAI